MMDWQPISTAPKDGTEVKAGTMDEYGIVWYPVQAIFEDGKWCTWFGSMLGWGPYEPQPTHWKPTTLPPES